MRKTIFTLFQILSFSVLLEAQEITGTVKNSDGQPLVGATISLKNSNLIAVADSSGFFRISAGSSFPATLQISSIGFKLENFTINAIPEAPLSFSLIRDVQEMLELVISSSRRREERAQDVPIPMSVIGGKQVENSGAFNVNRVKEMVPTVQLYSSNPRNTTLNIRGLGSTFGLTNDGIDPGVGFYVDGVYYARPAATQLDFVDIDQIEVLRGPQGTLFGKNTTAGAFLITTRPANFSPSANFEVSYGNYGFIQAKSCITGKLANNIAGRLSFSGTQRDGMLYNKLTQQHVNTMNNGGFRGQLLFTPSSITKITLVADATRQRPNGFAQVVAGVAPTLRAPYRQFEQIIKDLNYDLPSRNPFDRLIDHNTPWRSNNDLGGISLNIDTKIGRGTLTSTSAWRYWTWGPSNDRDFTGLAVLSLSQAPSKHKQWSQEIRYAGKFSQRVSGIIGAFALIQQLKSDSVHTEESGSAQWRFSQSSTSSLWATPGLFEGYGIKTKSNLKTFGGAVFGQLDWEVLTKLHLLTGLRYNYDKKDLDFNRQTYGGLQTNDPALLALKNAVYSNQEFVANAEENNFSGQVTLAYKPSKDLNAFATYSTSYKPVGLNLGGLPTANGKVMTELARVKPEFVTHVEAGLKTMPSLNSTLNITLFKTDIKDYQTQVQTAEIGVNRGYLANAEKVRVIGFEVDGNFRINKNLMAYGSVAYTEGKYVSFTNAPVPLEETGGPSAFKDISGGSLPGISKWAGSWGAEVSTTAKFLKSEGKYFFALDSYFRSTFSSSPSPSQYLNIPGYALFNARAGFKATQGVSVFLWARNILNKDYYEQLLPAAGNAGHYAGVIGDPATYGITMRYSLVP